MVSGRASMSNFGTSTSTEHELDPSELELCYHDNGAMWKLGEGGFGRVSSTLVIGLLFTKFFIFKDKQANLPKLNALQFISSSPTVCLTSMTPHVLNKSSQKFCTTTNDPCYAAINAI